MRQFPFLHDQHIHSLRPLLEMIRDGWHSTKWAFIDRWDRFRGNRRRYRTGDHILLDDHVRRIAGDPTRTTIRIRRSWQQHDLD